MPGEISMPQLSDTMSEGVVVKWHKKEGEKVREGDKIADVETDKAVMEMESFETGLLAGVLVPEGQKVKVGTVLAVVARAGEDPEKVKQQYLAKMGSGGGGAGGGAAATGAVASTLESVAQPPPPKEKPYFQFDVVVIGGGPAGYAAAIRAGQLKKRVLCVEKENLGGTCLNWGCIPTKALLENGALVRKLREHAGEFGIKVSGLEVDFGKIIGRSRGIAEKLSKGIAHLFRKYEVKSEVGTAQLVAPHKVQIRQKDGSNREVTAEHVIIATGAKPRSLPGIDFDGKIVISSREAMTLGQLPRRMAIIGAGAIGCEFADFYSSLGTQVTIIEVMDHLLPIEDTDCSILLERLFSKRGMRVMTKSKVEKVEKGKAEAKLTVSGPTGQTTLEADVVLQAVGVTGNLDGLFGDGAKVETFKGHIKVELGEYKTNLDGVWAVGDVIGPPWLAHVAHHEAVKCVERIFGTDGKGGGHVEPIDYAAIPGCTYTHPQVASLGLTERKARELGKDIRVGKFPFQASGRALAAGESDGFVKLIFDAKHGELLGVHMIGENVTELLSELVMAKKLEATEEEILEAMHPHPTLSEAVMEAAGVASGRAIHL